MDHKFSIGGGANKDDKPPVNVMIRKMQHSGRRKSQKAAKRPQASLEPGAEAGRPESSTNKTKLLSRNGTMPGHLSTGNGGTQAAGSVK